MPDFFATRGLRASFVDFKGLTGLNSWRFLIEPSTFARTQAGQGFQRRFQAGARLAKRVKKGVKSSNFF
jgi:hypothetical protein